LALHRAGFAWPPRHRDAGALLPHLFTFACTRLTCGRAIGRVFLWHFPAGFPGWALPTALPYGVRTFLEAVFSPRRGPLGPHADGSPSAAGCKPAQFGVLGRADRSRNSIALAHRPPCVHRLAWFSLGLRDSVTGRIRPERPRGQAVQGRREARWGERTPVR